MMIVETAIVIDCEYLTADGAQRRFWCGPQDPDPFVSQIGAVKLGLNDGAIVDTIKIFVQPIDRFGQDAALDPYFTELTGITQSTIESEGIPLDEALSNLDQFSEGSDFWSWGKDELNIAVSCYVAGIEPKISARRFDNARKLLQGVGMPHEDIQKTGSGELSAYFGIDAATLRAHDALDDALSVASVFQHLLRAGKLSKDHFRIHKLGGPEMALQT
jgi:DNA polymerase III epsilon subunit-like protein